MSNHIADANKMVREDVSDEQITAEATPAGELRRQILSQCVAKNEREWWAAGRIEKLEFELNAANDRIQSLIEERDRANRLAEWKWNLRDEFQLLLGTYKIEEGIEVVKEMKRRIKRLEEAGDGLMKSINCGCPYGPSVFNCQTCTNSWDAWRKAKEAKL